MKISQPVSCNTSGNWYEVLLAVLPLVSSTVTTAHMKLKLHEDAHKEMVEYPNDPPARAQCVNHFLERALLINLANVS